MQSSSNVDKECNELDSEKRINVESCGTTENSIDQCSGAGTAHVAKMYEVCRIIDTTC